LILGSSVSHVLRRRIFLTVALVVILVGTAGCSGVEPLSETLREQIEFESVSLPGQLWEPFMPELSEGTPVIVSGALTLPPTDKPVPAVIITHGCGGISSAESGWVRELEVMGIAALLLNSFEGRGVSSICTGAETVNIASMLVDLYRAADALDDHPYVDSSRVAVMGPSFGGRTALWSALERFQNQYGGRSFAGYVALYPSGCYIKLDAETEVGGGPILILHGSADDWLPIGQCESYVERLQAGGVDAELRAYEGAHHSFDDVTLPSEMSLLNALSPRKCEFAEEQGEIVDVATGQTATVDGPCVERGVTIGYNADARDQAVRDLTGFLEAIFDG
jgi:dienelactone hydrolase